MVRPTIAPVAAEVSFITRAVYPTESPQANLERKSLSDGDFRTGDDSIAPGVFGFEHSFVSRGEQFRSVGSIFGVAGQARADGHANRFPVVAQLYRRAGNARAQRLHLATGGRHVRFRQNHHELLAAVA